MDDLITLLLSEPFLHAQLQAFAITILFSIFTIGCGILFVLLQRFTSVRDLVFVLWVIGLAGTAAAIVRTFVGLTPPHGGL